MKNSLNIKTGLLCCLVLFLLSCKNKIAYINNEGHQVEVIDARILQIIENSRIKHIDATATAIKLRKELTNYFQDSIIKVAEISFKLDLKSKEEWVWYSVDWANQSVPLEQITDTGYRVVRSQPPKYGHIVDCLSKTILFKGKKLAIDIAYGELQKIYELNGKKYRYFLEYETKREGLEIDYYFLVPVIEDTYWLENCEDFDLWNKAKVVPADEDTFENAIIIYPPKN